MGNFFSDLFGGSNNSNNNIQPSAINAMTPQQQSVVNFLSGVVNNGASSYGQPYTGAFTAPLDTYQNQGLGSLQSYLNAPNVSQPMQNIQDYLSGLINNPGGSPQNAAYSAAADRNNALAVKNANSDFGSRGQFFSTAAINKIGDINAQTAIGKNTNLADQQTAAVGPATSLAQYISGIPLQKAAAGLQYGALPQQLDQQDLEAKYQDFIRQQNQVTSAAGGVMQSPQDQLYYPKQTPSLFSQLSPILGGALTSSAGQGALGSIGGMLSGAGSSIGAAAAGAGSSLMSFLGPLMAFL